MKFSDALWELILGSGQIPKTFLGSGVLVFAAGSAVMGGVTIILDWILFKVRARSVFGFGYGEHLWGSLQLFLFWGVGAGIGGFLGSAANILQPIRAACIGVGVGWPLILPRLIDSFTREAEQRVPEKKEDHDKEPLVVFAKTESGAVLDAFLKSNGKVDKRNEKKLKTWMKEHGLEDLRVRTFLIDERWERERAQAINDLDIPKQLSATV